MSAVAMTVPEVIGEGVIEALAVEVSTAGAGLAAAMTSARDRWSRLGEVFDVYGAEGATAMLTKPLTAAEEFSAAMSEAQTSMNDIARDVFPDLRTRRAELAARVLTVDEQYESTHGALMSANAAYWRAYETDSESESTALAREAQTAATDAFTAADVAVEELRAEIRTFVNDLEHAEELFARSLTKISGGDEVRGAWDAQVTSSQRHFGSSATHYPSAPSDTSDFADELRLRLATTVENRIDWLATGDREKVKEWLDGHPDFAGAVGFVDVTRAAKLWDDLSATSSRDEATGAWDAGPLAQLLAVAPAAIGNLNGIPSKARDEFNRKSLNDLLAGELTEEQRGQLEKVSAYIEKQGKTYPDRPLVVLSLFIDTADEEPRVTLGFGDVDNADQITTVSHGIDTNANSLKPWAASAASMYEDLNEELARKGSSATSAVVLFMEWDSGGAGDVLNIERPDAGAERLAQLERGFQISNPDARRDIDVHSLGTSMAAQMMADNEGLIDNAWFYGSAGVSENAAAHLEKQIRNGTLTLHVTHATDDFVAPLGRIPASEHPVDPRTIGLASEEATGDPTGRPEVFSSNGGWVEDFHTPEGEHGERTEGHNAQRSKEVIYLLDYTSPDRFLILPDDEAVGYLDPASQSYKQAIADHVTAILSGQEDNG